MCFGTAKPASARWTAKKRHFHARREARAKHAHSFACTQGAHPDAPTAKTRKGVASRLPSTLTEATLQGLGKLVRSFHGLKVTFYFAVTKLLNFSASSGSRKGRKKWNRTCSRSCTWPATDYAYVGPQIYLFLFALIPTPTPAPTHTTTHTHAHRHNPTLAMHRRWTTLPGSHTLRPRNPGSAVWSASTKFHASSTR